MKINFDAILKDRKGVSFKDGPSFDLDHVTELLRAEKVKEALAILTLQKDLTLEVVAVTALDAVFRDEAETLHRDGKLENFKLACKCVGVAELSPKEVAKIQDRIGRACPTPIVGAAEALLDPPAPARAPAKKEAA